MDEAILPKEEVNPEKRNDWAEIQNYVKAMNHAIARLSDLPVCMRLLQEAYKILLPGVRGESKQSGIFIPPHPEDMRVALKDLEFFWHNKGLNMPHLIKMAISHYQFETIHPFNDGNGRIGRMLITLYLIELGILRKPTPYLSDFFERNKGKYYDALTFVREHNDMDQWISFFLTAVIETAKKGKATFEDIIELRKKYEKHIMKFGKRIKFADALLFKLFSAPAITVASIAKQLNISVSAANTLANMMERARILKEVTGFSRNRVFILHEYVQLFER